MSEEFPAEIRRIGKFYVEGIDLCLNLVSYGVFDERIKRLSSYETDKLFFYLSEKLRNNGYKIETNESFGSWIIQISKPAISVEITSSAIEVCLEENSLVESAKEKREDFKKFLKEFEGILSEFQF